MISLKTGRILEVNLKEGTIKILKTGKVVKSKGFPDFIL